MKTLHLLRHAKSDWDDPGLPDERRPLNGRGRRDARAMAKYLEKHPLELDSVFCSTALRARKTLEAIAPSLGGAAVAEEPGLYGAAGDDLLGFVQGLPADLGAVMLVGHNPGLEELARSLAPEGKAFPTCALATIRFKTGEWSGVRPGKGRLVAFVTPADFA